MAIKKFNDYESAPAYDGDFETLPLGGHVLTIKGTKIENYDWGDVLILAIDIAEGEHVGFYQRQYDRKRATDAVAKWPGTFRQTIPSGDGSEKDNKSKGWFKGMITAIEKSNQGYTWNWDERTLAGKKVGGVFGQEEYLANDGSVKLATKCVQVRSLDAIRKGVDVPPIKKLKAGSAAPSAPAYNDSDLPFSL